ncbi:MAG: hypothetical protein KJ698_05235 [Actinobacteria bacterium]|nr:hypothetical protein [Actinomycetota bacterium]MBU1492807.1 hypothetical protein [Actinomycetota bacterium]
MRRWSLIVTALAVVAASCGGSDDGVYRELLSSHFMSGNDLEGALVFTEVEANCAAAAIVEAFGTAALSEMGYDPYTGEIPRPDSLGPPMSPADRGRWFAGIDGCIDLVDQVGGLLQDAGLSANAAPCVATAYRASGLLEEALLGIPGDPELSRRIEAALVQAMTDCGA